MTLFHNHLGLIEFLHLFIDSASVDLKGLPDARR